MKSPKRHFHHLAGATLVEAVIAVGVLAVAVPLVFGAIAEAGKGGQSAQAETRAPWIVRTCMEEIQASRDGRPRYFTATTTGQPFPPTGDVWALAFSADGKPVGKLSKSIYDKGTKKLDGKAVSYIAVLSAATQPPVANTTPMLKSRVSIEYPAAAPAKKRTKLDFHTRIP
jgi:hypothetical protein